MIMQLVTFIKGNYYCLMLILGPHALFPLSMPRQLLEAITPMSPLNVCEAAALL